MTHHTAKHRSQAMNDCIHTCTQCDATCLETVNYCLGEGGKHAAPDHITLMTTCADVCNTTGRAMLRGSNVHAAVCKACAQVCRSCAASCEAFGDDADMKRCVDACRRCAESCDAMATE
jgi:hypothetical protein